MGVPDNVLFLYGVATLETRKMLVALHWENNHTERQQYTMATKLGKLFHFCEVPSVDPPLSLLLSELGMAVVKRSKCVRLAVGRLDYQPLFREMSQRSLPKHGWTREVGHC